MAQRKDLLLGERLLYGAGAGFLDPVLEIIHSGFDVNWAHPNTGQTALHQAAMRGKAEVVRALIDEGALKVPNKTMQYPQDLANSMGFAEVADIVQNYAPGKGRLTKGAVRR
mmetsp:Transcript_20604/g.28447  ORF Transcript_20604/g.28447 Transcript_20604/m.28447 type:complete len:112 (+) Transcript_20604:52-387(+)|eukprot:CAMPEP_0201486716 /NCGR_PEP_ID=MMETSP0151_2-20130828/10777_1 /ASSEMBLY_ACC=CAM_ASM_000257 /TAXON_ID=200890 /ORGANISM="Paramoeba atlantica, Strain 621/1 / CCAP 1560/9" /LENGTH=111 /DNA_ID=CAMNT_0047871515 /DNA_START=1 /DNA_END=336 /DNA_ORIENTATION=+